MTPHEITRREMSRPGTARRGTNRRLAAPFLAPFLAISAASALLVTGAAPALAQGTERSWDQLWISAPYEMALLGADDAGHAPVRTLDIRLSHDNTENTVPGGTLTVDVTALTELAEIGWPANCAEHTAGTGQERTVTGVCSFPGLSGGNSGPGAEISVRAKAGAAQGASATVTSTAVAGELTAVPTETTVTVADGPDLGLGDTPVLTGVVPGSAVEVPIVLTNTGNRTADRTLLTLFASHGLDFAARYGNCAYLERDPANGPAGAQAICVLDEPLAPGRTVALDAGKLRVKSNALYDRFDHTVEPYSDEALERARAGQPYVQGVGADLTPRPVTAPARAAATDPDVDLSDNYRSTMVRAVNTADLRLIGSTPSGAAGETVTASVTVENRGPAWVASLGAGEPIATVDIIVPEGATVTAKPEGCSARTASGEWQRPQLGAPRYSCATNIWLDENGSESFMFSLRVDRVVPAATGRAVTLNDNPELRIRDFDPDLSNNETSIVVNG
ncbi:MULTISPECIES: hypothetical protein [unclassified Streptomyces]|uniref:hypothetical protein n=1 Tax=unclassified Streptomyces TaxID=2593676 RepID=UPI0037FDEAB4